jgi:hypothetical protein
MIITIKLCDMDGGEIAFIINQKYIPRNELKKVLVTKHSDYGEWTNAQEMVDNISQHVPLRIWEKTIKVRMICGNEKAANDEDDEEIGIWVRHCPCGIKPWKWYAYEKNDQWKNPATAWK